ncbi:MAG TPA: hypothetical protein VMH33_02880 [Solirubrobacterales bacterium]|nr:hypothetical protein [Solirubrobacterales bacterium]
MATVIYDADCGFCRWCLAVLLSWDHAGGSGSGGTHGRPSPPNLQVRWGRSAVFGALRPLPLDTEEADRLLADLTPEQRAASWHLVDDEGRRTSAGAALAPAFSLLPGGRYPATVFAHFPGATERGYRRVAEHRGLLGRFVPGRARRWADRIIVRSTYP